MSATRSFTTKQSNSSARDPDARQPVGIAVLVVHAVMESVVFDPKTEAGRVDVMFCLTPEIHKEITDVFNLLQVSTKFSICYDMVNSWRENRCGRARFPTFFSGLNVNTRVL